MLYRTFFRGAILLLLLVIVPACGSDPKTSKNGKQLPDQPPPEPRPAGKPG